MKIALAPDLHCFYNTYGRTDGNGENFREKEWDDCVDTIFQHCVKERTDVLVAPGDFFTNPRPTAAQVLKVAGLFQRFERAGIKVIGINGNHDIGSVNTKCMNDVVESIGDTDRWCANTFSTVVIGDTGFALLPYVKNAQMIAYNPEFGTLEMAESLMRVAGEMKKELEEKTKRQILVGHWTISGAGYSTPTAPSAMREVVLPQAELILQGWDACLFGHIHKPQILSTNPFIAYSGCVQRIALHEADDERLFYIYDTETKKYSSYALPAIKMKVIHGTINTEQDVERFLKKIEATPVQDHIVQIKYDIHKSCASLVKKKEINAILAKKDPLRVVGIVPRVVDSSVGRMEFNETMDASTTLRKWATIKGYDENTQKALLELMARYDKEAVV